MRILVTGGTGHLGRDIVSLLKDQGHQVRVLARTPGQDPAVEWIQGDLATGRGITEAVSGTEVIVHAATFSPAARRGWPLPTKLPMQPADEGDFAAYVAGCVADGPGGDQQPFGGPDIISFGEVAEQYQVARGLRRRILPLPLPRAAARAAGDLTCPEGRRGTTTWAEWLSRHPPRPE